MIIRNLLATTPVELPEELSEKLAEEGGIRIERIVSRGHASAAGYWYAQDETEWVLVVTGRARLQFEGDDGPVELVPGDFLKIPPHRKHRVEWTDPDRDTVWLAVFLGAGSAERAESGAPPDAQRQTDESTDQRGEE